MNRPLGRRARLLIGVAALAVIGGAAAALLAGIRSGSGGGEQTQEIELTTTPVERRDLAEYLEISGTLDYATAVTLTARSSGVLGQLASEGAIVERGEPLYVVLHSPTAAQTADAHQRLEAAQSGLLDAEARLNEALAGASGADIASARATLAEAVERRDELLEPLSTADLAAAEATVLAARQTLEDLQDPTAAALADAQSRLAQAEQNLADLLADATQADVDTARSAVDTAGENLADLLAGSTQTDIDTAEAAILGARQALEDLQNPTAAALADTRSRLAQAEQNLADLLSGPTQTDIDTAEAAILAARQTLEDLQNPTAAALADTRSRHAQAEQNLADLLSGPTQADINTAEAAVFLAAEKLDEIVDVATRLRPAAEAELSQAYSALGDARQQFSAYDAAAAEVASAEADLLNAVLAQDAARIPPAQDRLARARAELEAVLDGDRPPDVGGAERTASAAEQYLRSLADPEGADFADARAQLARATDSLNELLAGPSPTDIDVAEAALLGARQALEDLQNPTEAAIADARSRLAQAEQNLADLLAGPTQADVNSAEAALLVAFERVADLLAGATQADIDAAEAAILTATETLHHLQNPTEAALADARSRLAQSEQNLADLLAGATPADIEAAGAAVLVAEEALRDLLDPLTPDELVALEQSVASARAALAQAHSDVADLSDGYRALAVMYGSTPAYRTMSLGDAGADVAQLEENLLALGFGDVDGFAADGSFDETTEAAVRAWQRSTGAYVDGTVTVADVLFVTGRTQVGSWREGIELGRSVADDTNLATVTAIEAPADGAMTTTQRVVALLPLSERDLLDEGDVVNVELPDNTDVAGTVVLINPTPVSDGNESLVEVTITLAEAAPAVWIGASVDVEIVKTLVRDALVIPATALLALVEGGYAVEVLQADGATHLVGVETGLFADGDVEVRAAGLEEGTPIVVPR